MAKGVRGLLHIAIKIDSFGIGMLHSTDSLNLIVGELGASQNQPVISNVKLALIPSRISRTS